MKLNLMLFLGLIMLFISCRKGQESDNVNLIVTNKGDTISQVDYRKIPGYDFVDKADSIFLNKNSLSKLPGKFGFGIRSKLPMTSCWLVFQEVGEADLKVEEVPRVPFLYNEFEIDKESKVNLIYNYIDSLQEQPMMYQVFAAVNSKNNVDTLLFQESTYIVQNGNRFGALIVYPDRNTREEMRKKIDELVTTLKRSYSP